ncbi:hypothetical protein [Sinobacterium norvegicum]|uniref:hypothetical protein n=1 Tax=Sinobacterium norvegicum TaxID=1641715 RepID=UPI001F21B5F3|nr:hypothetical protein [Sinobacterium norvegicum]
MAGNIGAEASSAGTLTLSLQGGIHGVLCGGIARRSSLPNQTPTLDHPLAKTAQNPYHADITI